jgi:hypothetical protein
MRGIHPEGRRQRSGPQRRELAAFAFPLSAPPEHLDSLSLPESSATRATRSHSAMMSAGPLMPMPSSSLHLGLTGSPGVSSSPDPPSFERGSAGHVSTQQLVRRQKGCAKTSMHSWTDVHHLHGPSCSSSCATAEEGTEGGGAPARKSHGLSHTPVVAI